jgi:arylsulfatase A-like enzyme
MKTSPQFRKLRYLLWSALLPVALWSAESKPNIIFILADDLGYGDLGAYGQKMIHTPNLDKLAQEGMRFTDFYAGSTVCAPSRCSLMTGLHVGHTIIRQNAANEVALQADAITIPTVLHSAGYYNGTIGKWGMGLLDSPGAPLKQGLDSFYGYVDQKHAHNAYPSYLIRDTQIEKLRNVVPNEGHRGEGIASVRLDYSQTLFTEEALKFISTKRDKPFFLYLAYTLPHANNEVPKDKRADGSGMEVPSDAPYSNMDWPQPEKNKAAMITFLDKDVGTVMARLKELGIDDNTLVFFASDNGPHDEGGNDPAFFTSAGPYKGIKRDLYDGGVRVPFIARWPNKIAAGSTSDQIFAFWDVMPTLAELTAASEKTPSDGISFLPTLLGQTQKAEHPYLYWEFNGGDSKQSLRMGKWKAVRQGLKNNENAPIELYNIQDDVHEDHNVAAANPEVIKTIQKYMNEAHVKSDAFPLGDWEAAAAGGAKAAKKKKNAGGE